MAQTRYVTDDEVREHAPIPAAVDLVAEGFRAVARGEIRNFPVVRERIAEHDGIFGVKSGYWPAAGVLGLKAGGYWLQNPGRHGVGAHQSTVLLFQPESGQLRGVVAANYLTGLRTGAAGAVAARALAREGARRIGLIGAGVQAEMQLRCLAATRPIEQVLVWSVGNGVVESFLERTRDLGLTIMPVADPEAVVRGAEILVTTTPSFQPIVQAEWLHAGLHINAIGSDTRGKQELATQAVLRADRIVADSYEQASELGELQHPVRAGLIERSRVATLGEVLTGQSAGRQSEAEITLFDATGLIMQDLVVAHHVWQQVNG